jgi:hypothetical protein
MGRAARGLTLLAKELLIIFQFRRLANDAI